MKKNIEVYEGKVLDGFCGKYIDDDELDTIVSHIESLTGKRVRITIEELEEKE